LTDAGLRIIIAPDGLDSLYIFDPLATSRATP
jgi:hypothetical protein